MRAIQKTYGRLDVIEVTSDTFSEENPTIVLFHGYGADASDLASLSQAIELPFPVRWIFPEGPVQVALGGGYYGRAWFPIDIAALERAIQTGQPRDLANSQPPELPVLRDTLRGALEALQVKSPKLILGGFSQGAMLATDVALDRPENIAGLVILSGALLSQNIWKEKAPAHAGLPFFQSHGRVDSILDFQGAKDLEKLLTTSGLKGQLLPFQGGHEIPMDVLRALEKFLTKRLTLGAPA